tara:strand:- start:56 stop:574 length:519 start_codon:yes stop_codon:yes gene_type:complete
MDEANEYGDAPVKVLAAINRWVQYRDYPGSFVMRLLCNDLIGTVRSADEESLASLPVILRYLHNEVPTQCYGSEDKVNEWGEGPHPATDNDHLLLNATHKTLRSYLDAAHDVGEAKGARDQGADPIKRVLEQCRAKEARFQEEHGISSAEYFGESGWSDAQDSAMREREEAQ